MKNEEKLGLVLKGAMGTPEDHSLVNIITQYDHDLARATMDALCKRYTEGMTAGLKLGHNEEQESIARKAINHMLDNNKSKEDIFEYLTGILEIPEDTVEKVYSQEYNRRNPQPSRMDSVFTIVDQ